MKILSRFDLHESSKQFAIQILNIFSIFYLRTQTVQIKKDIHKWNQERINENPSPSDRKQNPCNKSARNTNKLHNPYKQIWRNIIN